MRHLSVSVGGSAYRGCLWLLTAACVSVLSLPVASALAAPIPKLGRTVVAQAAKGTVLVKGRNSGRFVPLSRSPAALPTGSTIDATRGTVRLVTATGSTRAVNSGFFSKGAFTVNQGRRKDGRTDLRLVGGEAGSCTSTGRGARAQAVPPRAVRALLGKAHGHFRTLGHYGAATVRGTVWLTEDRCDGTTYIADQRGVVDTSDPNGYLTLGALSLGAGDSSVFYCNPNGEPPVSRSFCIVAVSNPNKGLIAAGIVNFGPETNYDLCVTEPNSSHGCSSMVPFGPQQPDGRRISGVVCTAAAGAGTYLFSWHVGGVVLGPSLAASSNTGAQVNQCANFTG